MSTREWERRGRSQRGQYANSEDTSFQANFEGIKSWLESQSHVKKNFFIACPPGSEESKTYETEVDIHIEMR